MPAPYAPIIAPADLYTSMYPEVQTLITRGDATIAVKAIASAISEAKMYLSKYDLIQLFGDPVNNLAATVTDELLNDYIKNIAVWYLLRLANPSIDMSVAVTYYEKAISGLRSIQKGMAQPDGWPYKNTCGETAPQGDSIYARSNPPQHNFF